MKEAVSPPSRNLEDMQTALQRLETYHSDGYLFHGSKEKISVLEPRQARDRDEKKIIGNQKAVYAIDSLRVPIVKALLDAKDQSLNDWSSGYSDDGSNIEVSGRNFTFTPGYVHVLPRNSFIEIEDERGHTEIVSYEPVVPKDIVRVTPDMLNHLKGVRIKGL